MTQTLPIRFNGNAGFLVNPATDKIRSTGVVMCSSWGFEELCARKTFRCLADDLANVGFPVIRFDYPGTVDSLDLPTLQNFDCWLDSAREACELLQRQTNCRSVVSLGLGIGAVIASRLAEFHESVDGLILAAPVTSGRKFLRETNIRAKVIYEGLGLSSAALPKDRVSIAGLCLADNLVKDIRAIKLPSTNRSINCKSLIIERPSIIADSEFAENLKQSGTPVETHSFEGYDRLMEDPTAAQVPSEVVAGLVDWCRKRFPAKQENSIASAKFRSEFTGDHFIEKGVTFRSQNPLQGVLCSPQSGSNSSTYVFLNSGYDHHGGWARSWVRSARELAKAGCTSLRFDMSNIGDSPPVPGRPDQVLYTRGPIEDVSDALDFLCNQQLENVTLVGRCSGAYTAFHAAYADSRVKRVILINQVRLIWDPDESVTDAARMGPRPMSEYKRKLGDLETLKRLISGDINLSGVSRGLSKHLAVRISRLLAPIIPGLTKYARFRSECHHILKTLDERRVPVYFVCSEHDESNEQIELYFGKNGKDLSNYPFAKKIVIKGADHNITTISAQEELNSILISTANSPIPG